MWYQYHKFYTSKVNGFYSPSSPLYLSFLRFFFFYDGNTYVVSDDFTRIKFWIYRELFQKVPSLLKYFARQLQRETVRLVASSLILFRYFSSHRETIYSKRFFISHLKRVSGSDLIKDLVFS